MGLAAESAMEPAVKPAVDTLESNEADSDTSDTVRVRKIPKGEPLEILSLQSWDDWSGKHFVEHKYEDLSLIALTTTPYTRFDILKEDCKWTKPQWEDVPNDNYIFSDLLHFRFVDAAICIISIL